MRIATWNVNSLKTRMERLLPWLDRAAPDILFLQETKLTDEEAHGTSAPRLAERGYTLAHHGEGGRNGVAIASRVGLSDVVVNFGASEDRAEARMIAAVAGGILVVNVYAPNGRVVDTPTYDAKLAWYDRLATWLAREHGAADALVVGGDMNIAPDDRDVWDASAAHGGTHVSAKEREAFARLLQWGLVDAYRSRVEVGERYTWWDYRAGDFFKNFGMRIDHLLVSSAIASRIVGVEIDREARKGKPTPSDHAPLVLDLDVAGRAFDAGWDGAEKRIAARRAKSRA